MSVERYFDKRAAEWARHYELDSRFRRRLEVLRSLIEPAIGYVQGQSALDAGCGAGVFTRYLAQRGMQVHAVDLSAEMLSEARALLFREGLAASFEQVDLAQYTPAQHFDLILSLSVLEYIPDVERVIAALARVTRVRGAIVLSIPNHDGVVRRLERIVKRYGPKRGEYLEYQRSRLAPEGLDALMSSLGFVKRGERYFNTGMRDIAPLRAPLERRWWAAMYAASYQRVS